LTLAEYVRDRLAEAGVDWAFGVPGSFVMPVWQAFAQRPRMVLSRHESGGVYMADGWSRATGRLGVAVATVGPGLTNAVSGVACAHRDSVPLLLITGQAPTATFGRGAFLESYVLDRSFSPQQLFAPITKASLEVVDLVNARFLVDTAIALALSGRRGAVHLSLPLDLQQQALPDGAALPPPVAGPGAAAPDVAAAVKVLAEAERPLLLAGWGASLAGAGPALSRLAARAAAVTVTTAKAIACLGPDEPSLLGHVGPGQRGDLLPAIAEHRPDVAVVVGAGMSAYYAAPLLGALDGARIVRIDVDGDQLGMRVRSDATIQGDARAAVEALVEALGPGSSNTAAPERLAARLRERAARAAAAQPLAHGSLPSMAGTMARLGGLLPPDAVVIPDAGSHWLDTLALHRPGAPGGLQLNCGLGSMGWAIGAAIGMAFADRSRRVVCITGDGSALMHGVEASVAAEHELDVLFVVFNNRSHGRVRLGQRADFGGEIVATDIPDVDFAAWMRAMRVPSQRVDDPDEVAPALAAALGTAGTTAVEILCDPDEVPAALRDWTREAP
jgi:acetolactate synthase-1/2/3 large subunit